MTLPKLPIDPQALAAVLTGRKLASVLGGALLFASMPAEQQAHVVAFASFITGGQVWAAALALLGLSAWGSAASKRTERTDGTEGGAGDGK